MPKIIVEVRGAGRAPELREFNQAKVIIGRDSGNIVLGDHLSSGRHAELNVSAYGVMLSDLGSTNGTFMASGERVTSQMPLRPGSEFRIGTSVLVLKAFESGVPLGPKGTLVMQVNDSGRAQAELAETAAAPPNLAVLGAPGASYSGLGPAQPPPASSLGAGYASPSPPGSGYPQGGAGYAGGYPGSGQPAGAPGYAGAPQPYGAPAQQPGAPYGAPAQQPGALPSFGGGYPGYAQPAAAPAPNPGAGYPGGGYPGAQQPGGYPGAGAAPPGAGYPGGGYPGGGYPGQNPQGQPGQGAGFQGAGAASAATAPADPIALLKQALELFKPHAMEAAKAIGMLSVPALLLTALAGYIPVVGGILVLVLSIVWPLAMSLLGFGIESEIGLRISAGAPVVAGELWSLQLKRMFPWFIGILVPALIASLASVLCLVPGIVLGLFMVPAYMVERKAMRGIL